MRFFDCYYLLLQILVLLCGAEVVSPCLRCFTTPAERDRICHHAVSLGKMEAVECLQALHRGFEPLDTISIAFSQLQNIRMYLKSFEKEVKTINDLYHPPAWVEQFGYKIADFVKGVKDNVARHPPAECRPPCGLQKAARSFSCSRCAEEDCKLPVACPLEDMNIMEFSKTIIPCTGPFILPDHLIITWKYAKNIKVNDLSYFKDLKTGNDLLIESTRVSHIGTYACEIVDEEEDIILRNFYYLNVIGANSREGNILQDAFHLHMEHTPPARREEEEEKTDHVPSTMKKITSFLQSDVSAAIYAAFFFIPITISAGFLCRYALSVDW